jgi:cyanophycin synthetase
MVFNPAKLTETSGDLVVEAAAKRGITVLRFPEADLDTVVLEHDDHREPLYYSRTNRQGSVSVKITDNKALTSALLRHGGFPTPTEIITNDIEAARSFLKEHGRIVIKPLSNTGGIGVTPGVMTVEQLEQAWARAQAGNRGREGEVRGLAVVQQHLEGRDFRVLVVNQRHVFVIERIPAHVVGDGQRAVEALVAAANQQRNPDTHIVMNEQAQELLAEQDLVFTSVPARDQHVRLARVANYHAGGSLHDVTDSIHPSVAETGRAVATYFNLGIVGVDCISPDIATTIGMIIELNGTPDITIHHFPDKGVPRDVAGAMVDMLYPEVTL